MKLPWLLSACLCVAATRPALAAPELGKPAPTFSLRDRDGALTALEDLAYPGDERPKRPRHVVVIDFFRTDCAPCKKGLPKLAELQKRFAAKRVKVILIALLEEEEGQEKLDRFLKQNPLSFLVLLDPYGTAAKKYIRNDKGGFEIPSLFVIDRRGVLRERTRGVSADSQPRLQKLIEELSR